MNQKDGVYGAIATVFGGDLSNPVRMTEAQKDQVHALVVQGFKDGLIEYKGGVPNDEALKKYVPGLVNNWVRKDLRLNGGNKYETKKPGSRAGSSDEGLKAMRALRSITTDADQLAMIDAAIAERQAEIKPKPVLNVEALPPHLRKFVSA